MRFHAGSVSDQNQRKEVHSDSPTGRDFMQAMSVIEIEPGKRTQLTSWMEFHAGNVSDRNRAEAHSDSPPGWGFMRAISVIEIEQRRRPATHSLDEVSCRQCQ